MAAQKKILVTVPNKLLEEIDKIIKLDNQNRSEFVREAMRLYMREKKRLKIAQELKIGYQEMAVLNQQLSENNFNLSEEATQKYEELLTRKENKEDYND